MIAQCFHYVPLQVYAKRSKNILSYKKSSVLRLFVFFYLIHVVIRLSQRHHPFKPAWKHTHTIYTHIHNMVHGLTKNVSNTSGPSNQCGYILLSCPYQISQKEVYLNRFLSFFLKFIIIFTHMVFQETTVIEAWLLNELWEI